MKNTMNEGSLCSSSVTPAIRNLKEAWIRNSLQTQFIEQSPTPKI
uniref:Uncharacterized protein n=1 Tax=Arundo donax TaxID=35708 RepID=A0A0A9HUB9_ARUDO